MIFFIGRGGGQGGCEWRNEAFVKIYLFIFFFFGGGGSGPGGSGCGRGVRVDVNGEVKFCENSKKNIIIIFFWGGRAGGSDQAVGWGRGRKVWGRWVMWGMACKPRIKGIDKCK